MTNEEFVKRVQIAVYEASIKGCLSLLEKPPGRRSSGVLLELSQWFKKLSHDDKKRVEMTIKFAVRAGVFGMLTVLDGVTSIWESEEEMGTLELRYNTKEKSILLNNTTGEFLHDLFAEQVPPM